jgi:hypothetical protein
VSDRRADAAAILARLGVDAERVAAGAVPAADLAGGIAGPDGEALASALGELSTPAAAALLADLEPYAPDRDRRKAIRRALYRLAQRGVAAPPRAAIATRRAAATDVEGFVSHFDGRGDRLIWLVRALPTGGAVLVAATLNEPGGLLDVHSAEVSRKQLRATRQRLETEAHLRLVPAPWRPLDALLVEAHERAGAPDRNRDYLRIRPRLTTEPPTPPAEPASAHAAPPGPDEAAAVAAGSAALLAEPELATWWPAEEALAPFVRELAGVRESPLVLNRLQQEERIRETLRRAATLLVPPPVFARRLEGTAYVLAETGRAAAARQALAAAACLRARPAEAADVPVVAAWVERALGQRLAEETARREESGSLVMTPGQFLRDRPSSRPGRTRG